jgi:pimeloyl-ACP methyl ester carboxylesterase
MSAPANVILVHGAWADGSCWSGVIERLQADGYHVTAPQFPLTALADDVARLRHVLDLERFFPLFGASMLKFHADGASG